MKDTTTVLVYCLMADDDTLKTCLDIYCDGWKANQAAAEHAYISKHRALPEWGQFVEAFEVLADGGLLFIHADPCKGA